MNWVDSLLFSYQDGKIWASDQACSLSSSVTPALFTKYCSKFIDGFLVTVELLILSSCLAFIIAVLVVLARMSHIRVLSWAAYTYTYVFRGTPLLVQLWVFYYGFGTLGPDVLGPFWFFFETGWRVGLLTLTMNSSAYVAEILRGGIDNIAKGQLEAALAIGMSWQQRMRRIVFPQALSIAWPAYGNEIILLLKGSALVSTITVFDLMGVTRTVFARGYNLEVFFYASVLYLLLVGFLTLLLRCVENYFFRKGQVTR